ncbi:MAG: hypothetical protein JWQ27_1559 [Ferruginibacter sp.]|nr:hypothetical protein [Ferruginibacter sp.]
MKQTTFAATYFADPVTETQIPSGITVEPELIRDQDLSGDNEPYILPETFIFPVFTKAYQFIMGIAMPTFKMIYGL